MNYKNFTTWQEQDGKLVPVKPDDKNYATGEFHRWEKDFKAYSESLKLPPLTVIGDIESIKGRKDLKIDVDFRLEDTMQMYQDRMQNIR